jgi:hypothetical protein
MAGIKRVSAADVQSNALFLAENCKVEFVRFAMVDERLKGRAEAG